MTRHSRSEMVGTMLVRIGDDDGSVHSENDCKTGHDVSVDLHDGSGMRRRWSRRKRCFLTTCCNGRRPASIIDQTPLASRVGASSRFGVRHVGGATPLSMGVRTSLIHQRSKLPVTGMIWNDPLNGILCITGHPRKPDGSFSHHLCKNPAHET